MNTIQINEESRTLYYTCNDAVEVEIMSPLRDIFAEKIDQNWMAVDDYISKRFDVQEIVDECIEWTDRTDEHPAGFYCVPNPDEFWEIVERYDRVVGAYSLPASG